MAEVKLVRTGGTTPLSEASPTADSARLYSLGLGAAANTAGGGQGSLTIGSTLLYAHIDATAGDAAAVSAASHGRLRYNTTSQRWEASENTGGYQRVLQPNTADWRVNGKPLVATNVDGAWIAPFSGKILRVTLYRRTAGTGGSTTVDVNKNGTTIYTTPANRPTVTAAGGNDQLSTTTPDVTTFAQNDRIQIDIDAIETGNPQDLTLVLTVLFD